MVWVAHQVVEVRGWSELIIVMKTAAAVFLGRRREALSVLPHSFLYCCTQLIIKNQCI